MSYSTGTKAFIGSLAVLLVAATVAVVELDGARSPEAWWVPAALCGVLIADLVKAEVRLLIRDKEAQSITHDETVLVVLLLLVPPFTAILVFLVANFVANVILRREPIKTLFNVANSTGAAAAAALTTIALGLVPGSTDGRTIAAAIAGTAVFLAWNTLNVGFVLMLVGAERMAAFLKDTAGAQGRAAAASAALGLLAGVAAQAHLWTLGVSLIAVVMLHMALAGELHAVVERRKLADVIEASSDGVLTIDPGGTVLTWNPALEKCTGVETADAIGRQVADLLALSVDGRPLDILTDSSLDSTSTLARLDRPDGLVRWLSLQRAHRPELGYVVMARDVTAQKHAEENEAAQREARVNADRLEGLGRLAGGVAHDFNNILTALMGYGGLAAQAAAKSGDAALAGYCRQIQHMTTLGSNLTHQLLAYSRRQELHAESVDLAAAVDGLVPMLRRLVGSRVRIETSAPAGLASVVVDRTQLDQVILNLVVNARDAMPAGGVVGVTCAHGRDGFVELRVSDTGEGMPPHVRERIFEPFFTTKPEGEGTGLGLATVHGIVAQSGGTIVVESVVGRGTTFVVSLPTTPQRDVPVASSPG